MNPLTWSGPRFLIFYVLFGGAVAALVPLVRHRLGADGLPAKRLTGPYAIALIRAGHSEAIRIAVMSLARRGWLRISGRCLQAESPEKDLRSV